MKIGIIREGKTPADSRVPLSPSQIADLKNVPNLSIVVQPSPNRCFSDEEFKELGIEFQDDLSDCDVLMGVKEVPIENLIPNKTYFFFSHTIKKQPYNQKLLQTILEKNIRLLDYEVLTNDKGQRLIAFGKFAGMVGAHNALWTYGRRTNLFSLPRMNEVFDYKAVKEIYNKTIFPSLKIVLTGKGRVGYGAAEVLKDMGIKEISKEEYLKESTTKPVFVHLDSEDYIKRKGGARFVTQEFYENPLDFECDFSAFYRASDIMINGIYWDNKAPAFFDLEELKDPKFKIQVIADVTCDIAPESSIPTTLFASTIADPIFGFDPATSSECKVHSAGCIDMMTIDNLPNEMPRDASEAFGKMFLEHILEELLKEDSEVIERGTVAKNGKLGKHFQYLEGYVNSMSL